MSLFYHNGSQNVNLNPLHGVAAPVTDYLLVTWVMQESPDQQIAYIDGVEVQTKTEAIAQASFSTANTAYVGL